LAARRIQLVIGEQHNGQRLDQALAALLPAAAGMELSKAKIRKLIVAGAVYLNTGRIRIASKAVCTGSRIEVYLDPAKLMSDSERAGAIRGKPREWGVADVAIIHEDEWIVGLNKPPGLPTQPTVDEARANLYALLKKHYAAKAGGEPYVGLHHRLDRDTSGVILFTRKKEANAEVGRLFQSHLARKTYLAIVTVKERRGGDASRELPDEWTVENFLAREPGKAGRMRSVRSGGDAATTGFRVLDRKGAHALVEARPRTGRMHQIRVHLSEGGAPIAGDATYGGDARIAGAPVPRVMLHAAELEFPHPVTGEDTRIRAPLPADFTDCLKRLGLRAPGAATGV
jgi:RluA family pseudouridine synthase